MNPARTFRSWFAVALLGLGLAAGCARAAEERCCPCADKTSAAGKQLDQRLMLLLSTARSYHHQADLQQRQGQLDQALVTINKILALELDSRWPEAEEARLDATARLAKLLLSKEQAARALATVDRGISSARRESFFLSNLHSVRGEVLEFQAKALDRAGDQAGARKVSRDAMAAYEASIAINKRLQLRLQQQGR